MTKKKSILFQVLFLLCVCGIVIGILMLTSCGNPDEAVLEAVEFNGNENFATSNIGNITNQEAFDLMIQNPGALFVFLDLVDELVLRGNFEIDDDNTEGFWESFKTEIADVDEWMLQNGFASEEDVIRTLELEELRESAVRHLVEITDEQIEEVFEEWFDPETNDLEDMRDEIYNTLYAEAIGEVSVRELARLRFEADLVIFNETLGLAYENFLESWGTGIGIGTYEASTDTEVIARVNDTEITIGHVFAALSNHVGIAMAFEHLDEIIIAENFIVDPAEINEMIEEVREDLGENFYDALAASGIESEEELFEHLERMQIEEDMIREHFTPSEDRLREMYAEMGETVSGSHILVGDYEEAMDLIEYLQDTDDLPEAFADLAAQFSLCGSAAGGGDLGTWGRGTMVEEFDNAIFGMEVGEITDSPVETEHGFHIIYKTAGNQEFEDIREDLIEQELARLQQMPGAINEVLMDLRQDVGLQFTNFNLQARYESFANANPNN